MLRKFLSFTVIVCFSLTTLAPYPQAHADTVLGLPAPGTMVNLSPAYEPMMIKGLTVHKDNPFLFDFIVDVGQDKMTGEPLKQEGEKLIKYFLASLAIPDKDVWVNLSPYEKNRLIPEALGKTDMGRDLLEQDYMLKQITASLIYPEKQLGKNFWDKVYAKTEEMYGTTQIPVNTFNKVWIMADRAEVFEHNQSAFVVDSHLKVMLEEDYLALQKHGVALPLASRNDIHSIGANIVREIVLPELEKEVNTGKNFANLRQIFNSIILSSWYKRNLKQALLNQVYANKAQVKGINLNDPMVKEQIYEQYLKAYKKGVFNYIKDDVNAAGQTLPRKYFSGGIDEAMAAEPVTTTDTSVFASFVRTLGTHLINFAAYLDSRKIPESDGFKVIPGQVSFRNNPGEKFLASDVLNEISNLLNYRKIYPTDPFDPAALDLWGESAKVIVVRFANSYASENKKILEGLASENEGLELSQSGRNSDLWSIDAGKVDEFYKWLTDIRTAILRPADKSFRLVRGPEITPARIQFRGQIETFSSQKANSDLNTISISFAHNRGLIRAEDQKPEDRIFISNKHYFIKDLLKAMQGALEIDLEEDKDGVWTVARRDADNFAKFLYKLEKGILEPEGVFPYNDGAMLSDDIIHVVDGWLQSSDRQITEEEKDQMRKTLAGFSTDKKRFEQWKFAINTVARESRNFKKVEDLLQFLRQLPGMGSLLAQKAQEISQTTLRGNSQQQIEFIFSKMAGLMNMWGDHEGAFLSVDIMPKKIPTGVLKFDVTFLPSGKIIPMEQLSKILKGEDEALTVSQATVYDQYAQMLQRAEAEERTPQGREIKFLVTFMDNGSAREAMVNGPNNIGSGWTDGLGINSGVFKPVRIYPDQFIQAEVMSDEAMAVRNFGHMWIAFSNQRHTDNYTDDVNPLVWDLHYGGENDFFRGYQGASPEELKSDIQRILKQNNNLGLPFLETIAQSSPTEDVLNIFIDAMQQQPQQFAWTAKWPEDWAIQKMRTKNALEAAHGKYDPKVFAVQDEMTAVLWRLFTLWYEKDEAMAASQSKLKLVESLKDYKQKFSLLLPLQNKVLLRNLQNGTALVVESRGGVIRVTRTNGVLVGEFLKGVKSKLDQIGFGITGNNLEITKLFVGSELQILRIFKISPSPAAISDGTLGSVLKDWNISKTENLRKVLETLKDDKARLKEWQLGIESLIQESGKFQDIPQLRNFISQIPGMGSWLAERIDEIGKITDWPLVEKSQRVNFVLNQLDRLLTFWQKWDLNEYDVHFVKANNIVSGIQLHMRPEILSTPVPYISEKLKGFDAAMAAAENSPKLKFIGNLKYYGKEYLRLPLEGKIVINNFDDRRGVETLFIESKNGHVEVSKNDGSESEAVYEGNPLMIHNVRFRVNNSRGLLVIQSFSKSELSIIRHTGESDADEAMIALKKRSKTPITDLVFVGHTYEAVIGEGSAIAKITIKIKGIEKTEKGIVLKVIEPGKSKETIFDGNEVFPLREVADIEATAKDKAMNGGIDLNTSNGMQWKVSKDGNGVEMNIDPVMIERIRREGIDSLSPVILRMTPITSIWSLAGLQESVVK